MNEIAENIENLKNEISAIAVEHGYAADQTQLIAVSKVQPDARIQAALDAGQRLYGENRVQEAQAHWAHRRADYPDLELHLIGPLQTNKAKDAVALFDVIQSVDREKLARVLAKEMDKAGKKIPCYIQVNTGEEEQKAGVASSDLSEFITFCRDECGLQIDGLMCIPPVDEPPALHFALLKTLAQDHGLDKLSMGMSGDYGQAAALGADYVRIGSAVFGAREYA